MIINYRKLNILGVDGINFKPGVHEYPMLNSAKIDAMAKLYPKFRLALDEDIEIVHAGVEIDDDFDPNPNPKTVSPGQALQGMKQKDAIRLIRDTGDINLLNAWMSENKNPEIDKAIKGQLLAIEKAGEPEKKD